ncbi:hypothetical protein GTH32_17090 [Alteromonas sp. 345S023]|uniref:Lipoprotein n=2 Tax=Alteromonas profundi TaxID=2696062 RepID=A0A7X5LNZ2_9ALTE|nr:hypothetical protein [Alteromonas profundi]
MRSYSWFILISFITLLFLSGCDKKEKGVGRYGMLDENTPEYVTIAFLRSIYEDDNLDTAIALSDESLARILTRYHTNGNAQRHLINLKYDTVELTPQSNNDVGRNQYAEKSTITVFFSGMYDGDKIEDIRSIDLKKIDGEWKITKVHPDHFF